MPRILQPAVQKRLTNVAVVRLKQDTLRFEVACYPNKVKDWRQGNEKDISEVLQSDRIFSNVHKGQFAKDQDIQQTFGTQDFDQVVKTILNKGEIQISGQERKTASEQFLKEVSQLAAERLRSASTGCPLTAEMVENCMKQMKWKPKYKSGVEAKAAANRVVDKICRAFSNEIQRTLMRATILCSDGKIEETKSFLQSQDAYVLGVEKSEGDASTITFQVANACYRAVEAFVINTLGNSATLSVVSTFDVAVVQPKAQPVLSTEPAKIVLDDSTSESEEDEEESDEEAPEFDRPPHAHIKNHFEVLLSDDDESADVNKDDFKILDEESDEEEESKAGKSSAQDLQLSHREIRQREKELDKKRRARERKLEAKRKEDDEILRASRINAAAQLHQHPLEVERPADAESWCDVCHFDYLRFGFTLRQHVKDEWHIFNQKRKVRSLEPISRAEHADLARDLKTNFLAVE